MGIAVSSPAQSILAPERTKLYAYDRGSSALTACPSG